MDPGTVAFKGTAVCMLEEVEVVVWVSGGI